MPSRGPAYLLGHGWHRPRGRRLGRTFHVTVAAVLWLLLAPRSAPAQTEVFSTRSVSGQFIVQVAPGAQLALAPANLETNRNFVRLDPTLVPVSCERIKQIIWRMLEAKAPYSGKIFVTVYPGRGADQPIAIDAEQFRDGWAYRLTLPSLVERVRFVRTVVQAVLLEMANRAAVEHTAEVPPWLTEGLAQELLASRQIEIILPPPSTPANHIRFTYTPLDARRTNSLDHAHQVLTGVAPLTFQQLSWSAVEELTGSPAECFSSSAQLFVHQLLQFRDGGVCLRNMLAELPKYYNWQFAFLHAFQAHFSRPLEVEKWWSLETVHFTGRDLSDAWTADESWHKLEEMLHPAVQVRTAPDELPLRAEVSLQTIIRDWDASRQPPALQTKLQELESLRLRLAKDLVPLVDEYRKTVATYLENRQHTGWSLFRKRPSAQQAARTAIQQLDALDARFSELRPPSKAPVQANAKPPV